MKSGVSQCLLCSVWVVLLLVQLVHSSPIGSSSDYAPSFNGQKARLLQIIELLAKSRQMINSDLDSIYPDNDVSSDRGVHFKRERKQNQSGVLCRNRDRQFGDCNDGLMGVWLRLIKNPEYEE